MNRDRGSILGDVSPWRRWGICWAGVAASALASLALFTAATAQAFPRILFSEGPNDTPEQAQAFRGEARLSGAVTGSDRDVFLWRVDDAEAGRFWDFELESDTQTLVRVDIVTLESDPDILAQAGVESGWTGRTELVALESRALRQVARHTGVLVPPGEYYIGVTSAGGGGAYRFTLSSGASSMPPSRPAATLAAGRPSIFRIDEPTGEILLDLGEDSADAAWRIGVRGELDAKLTATLVDADGRVIGRPLQGGPLPMEWSRMALPAGVRLRVERSGGATIGRLNLALNTDGRRVDGREVEPNDRVEQANWTDLRQPFSGQVTPGDRDFVAFEVDETLAKGTQVLRVDSSQPAKVCIGRFDGQPTPCRIGSGDRFLAGLQLASGEYFLSIESGRPGGELEYQLQLVPGPAARADEAVEPNDEPAWAGALLPRRPVRGQLLGSSPANPRHAYFELVVDGEPQYWRFQATGARLNQLQLLDPSVRSGALLAHAHNPVGQPLLRIDRILLLPGRYLVRVSAVDSDYLLRALPLGLPQPGFEQEPNDSAETANPLPFGMALEGNFSSEADRDHFRFHVPGQNRVALELTPPGNGGLSATLERDGQVVLNTGTLNAARSFSEFLPPGDYVLALRPQRAGELEYRVRVKLEPPWDAQAPGDRPPVEVTLAPDGPALAAEREVGQQVAARLALHNPADAPVMLDLEGHASHSGWTLEGLPKQVELAAGERRELALRWRVPAGLPAQVPVQLFVRAGGAVASAALPVRLDAPPLAPFEPRPIPPRLLGLTNLAWSALGARFVDPATLQPTESGTGGYERLGFMIDNQASTVSSPTHRQPSIQVPMPPLELAGGGGEIHALVFNQRSRHLPTARWREVRVEHSADGRSFELLAMVELSADDGDQVFELEPPVATRFLRIQPLSLSGTYSPSTLFGTGLLRVLGNPADAALLRPNLLDPLLGGHWLHGFPDQADSLDFPWMQRPATDGIRIRGHEYEAVFGFFQHRAARLDELRWREAPGQGGRSVDRITVLVSTASPVGPWAPLGDWTLVRDASGEARLALDAPTWVRYLKLVIELPEPGQGYAEQHWKPPVALAAYEAPGEDARSVLGFWGTDRRQGPYELALDNTPVMVQDRDSRPAAPRTLDGRVVGQVAHPGDVRSYRVRIPEGHNTAVFELGESHRDRVRARLVDATGAEQRLEWEASEAGRRATAVGLAPGDYRLDVEEPPRSLVFMWDASGSLAAYQSVIQDAIRHYAEGIERGREAANLMVLGGPLLVHGWAEHPLQLIQGLAAYDQRFDSSDAEPALMVAIRALEERGGERVIFLITDADQGGRAIPVWRDLERVRPRIFTIEISDPAFSASTSAKTMHQQQLMQAWAAVGGGQYRYAASRSELVRAFESGMQQVRQPTIFSIAFSTERREPPRPGLLQVTSGKAPAVAAGVVHLIFDASGSMLRSMQGGRRIEVARRVVREILSEQLPPGVPVALRAFGHTAPHSCETELLVPPEPGNRERVLAAVDGIQAINLARTPLGASLQAVPGDLGAASGNTRLVVMLTDGEETCDGDVEKAVAALAAQGVGVRLNIVGFHIDDAALRIEFERLAELGGGSYFDSRDADSLVQALGAALAATWEVRDADGQVVARGRADDPEVELPAGNYTLVLATADGERREALVIEAGQRRVVEINR